MNNEHNKLLESLTPRPLPTKEQYDKEQAQIDPNKPKYYVRDKYGIERPLPPTFQPQNDEQIRYIVRARNITVIKKTASETKEFMPKSEIKLQPLIINSFEILHQQHAWIHVQQVRYHLLNLDMKITDDEILNEIRYIYKKAKTNKDKVICNHRSNMDGKDEFQIKLRHQQG